MDNLEIQDLLLQQFSNYKTSELDEENENNDNDVQTHETNDDQAEPLEAIVSGNESDAPENRETPLNFEWISARREGDRLGWDGVNHQLYYKDGFNIELNADAFTCTTDECYARLFLRDGEAFKLASTPEHTHGPVYHVYKEIFLFNWMKNRCKTAPASASTLNIYEEALAM